MRATDELGKISGKTAAAVTAVILAAAMTATATHALAKENGIVLPASSQTTQVMAGDYESVSGPVTVLPDGLRLEGTATVSYKLIAPGEKPYTVSVSARSDSPAKLYVKVNGAKAGAMAVKSKEYADTGSVSITLLEGENTLTFGLEGDVPVCIRSFSVTPVGQSLSIVLRASKTTSVYRENIDFYCIGSSDITGEGYTGKARLVVDSFVTELDMTAGILEYTASSIPAGVHSVRVIIPASGTVSNTVSLTVRKAKAILPEQTPKGLEGVYGSKISTVKLPAGYRWVNDSALIDRIPASEAAFEARYNSDPANFEDAAATLAVTVTKRPVTVTAQDKRKTSDMPTPELTWKVTSGDIIAGDELAIRLRCEMTGTSGGAFRIVAEDPAMLENAKYEITFREGTLTVDDSPALAEYKKHLSALEVPGQPGEEAAQLALRLHGMFSALSSDDQACVPAELIEKTTQIQTLAGEYNHTTGFGSLTQGTLPWHVRISVVRMGEAEVSQSGLKNITAAYTVSLADLISESPYFEPVSFTLTLNAPDSDATKSYMVSRLGSEPVTSVEVRFHDGAADFPITGAGSYALHTRAGSIQSGSLLALAAAIALGLTAAVLGTRGLRRRRAAHAVRFSPQQPEPAGHGMDGLSGGGQRR